MLNISRHAAREKVARFVVRRYAMRYAQQCHAAYALIRYAPLTSRCDAKGAYACLMAAHARADPSLFFLMFCHASERELAVAQQNICGAFYASVVRAAAR